MQEQLVECVRGGGVEEKRPVMIKDGVKATLKPFQRLQTTTLPPSPCDGALPVTDTHPSHLRGVRDR